MREDILICIFNYRHDENARRWLNLLSPYFETVVLDSGNNKKCDDFIQFPNIYYSGLFNEMKKLSEKKAYKWVGIITSDVTVDDENGKKIIEKLDWLLDTVNLGVYSILGDKNGHNNSYNYGYINNVPFRYIEGFFQIIKKEVIDKQPYIDTSINLFGHGIDHITCYLSFKLGLINYVDEEIKIFHPKEEGYNFTAAQEQRRKYTAFLQKNYFSDYTVVIKNNFKRKEEVDGKDKIITNKILALKYCYVDKITSDKEEPIFVSMTSWKKRLKYVPQAISNLKKQTIQPDKVFVWLSSEEISKAEVPQELFNDGFVEVKWVDKNIKSFKKFLTIQQHPEAFNVIVDEDMLYVPTFIEDLMKCSKEHNNNGVVCYSCNACTTSGDPWGDVFPKMKSDIKWVSGGVTLYPPNVFPMESFDYYYDIMKNYENHCDEAFLMPFIIHNNIPIYVVKDDNWRTFFLQTRMIADSQKYALHDLFFEEKGNFKTNKKAQLLKEIISNLPTEYQVDYKKAFPNFEPIKKDIFRGNETLKKICEPAEGELTPYYSEKERLIVTMTSWKKRIENVEKVLKSVLNNTVLPDLIIVNLAIEEFPNKENDLPLGLNELIKSQNGLIEINWLKNNTKVWKKIFPTLLKYPNDTSINIDDDFIYPNDIIETFKSKRENTNLPLSGVTIKLWKNHIQHCGCASLDRLEWFGDYLYNINEECLKNLGDDDFYTYCFVANNIETAYVGKKFFMNMQPLNAVEGYTRTMGLLSRSKITAFLNSLPLKKEQSVNKEQITNKENSDFPLIDSMMVSSKVEKSPIVRHRTKSMRILMG